MDDKQFEVRTYDGILAYCSSFTWSNHIVLSREWLRNNEEYVVSALEDPVAVYGSSQNENRDVYFWKKEGLTFGAREHDFLKVILHITGNQGEVISAFSSPAIQGGIDERKLKYVRLPV